MRTILLLSGTAPPVPAVASGGLTLSGGSAPVAALEGTGGLTLSATAAPVPGAVGLGGWTLSGDTAVVVVAAGSGGLSLSGHAAVVAGLTGSGGLTLSGVATAVAHAAAVAAASGGLTLTGHAVTSPGLVGTGGLSLAGVAAVTGMHAAPSGFARYPGYFCSWVTGWRTTYYPGSSGLVAGGLTLDTLPGTFLAAVRTTLRADAGLMGMLRGGVWHRVAPPGVREPLLVFIVPSEDRKASTTAADYIEEGQLQLSVYGPVDSVAVAIANRAVAALTDAHLMWATGATFYLRPADPASPGLPRSGYGGSRVFGEVRVLDFKNYGNFAVG